MNSEGDHPTSTILVVTDTENAEGSVWRAVVLYADGSLAVQGYDTGPGVHRAHGAEVYEFARELDAADTDRLRRLIGVTDGGDLLGAIGERFGATEELEAFLTEKGVPGRYTEWTR